MACFGISLCDLLPCLRRFIDIPSPGQSHTSPPRSFSIPEECSSLASHKNSVNSRTEFVSRSLDVTSPAPLHTVSKSTTDDKHHMWKQLACKKIRQLPMIRSRERPDAVYSPTMGTLFIPALVFSFFFLRSRVLT